MNFVQKSRKEILSLNPSPNKIFIVNDSSGFILTKLADNTSDYKYIKTDNNGDAISISYNGIIPLTGVGDHWKKWYIVIEKKEIFKYII